MKEAEKALGEARHGHGSKPMVPFWSVGSPRAPPGTQLHAVRHLAVGQTNGIPFWSVGEFTTHFRTYFSGWIESDVHWGYDLGFDPQPHQVLLVSTRRTWDCRIPRLLTPEHRFALAAGKATLLAMQQCAVQEFTDLILFGAFSFSPPSPINRRVEQTLSRYRKGKQHCNRYPCQSPAI